LSVNKRIDHWDIPQSTPLHWAAGLNREELAKLLLEKGADPNILAGDGLTALDVADARNMRPASRRCWSNTVASERRICNLNGEIGVGKGVALSARRPNRKNCRD